KTTDDLLVPLQPRKPGDKIKLGYRRGDKQAVVEIQLAKRPGPDAKGEKRGNLGIQFEDSEDGLVLVELVKQGAAEQAGLKARDVLLALEGTRLENMPALFKTLAGKAVGHTVKVKYRRGGEQKEVEVRLGPRLAVPGRPSAGPLGGQRANAQDL